VSIIPNISQIRFGISGWEKGATGSVVLETEDAIARPDAAVDLEGDLLAGPRLLDRLVLDLQRMDHLPEIGSTTENMDDVAEAKGVCEVEDGDAEPAIKMGHVTDELAGHGSLLLGLAGNLILL